MQRALVWAAVRVSSKQAADRTDTERWRTQKGQRMLGAKACLGRT